MPDERFALLSNLGRKITDYSVDKEGGGDGKLDNLHYTHSDSSGIFAVLVVVPIVVWVLVLVVVVFVVVWL